MLLINSINFIEKASNETESIIWNWCNCTRVSPKVLSYIKIKYKFNPNFQSYSKYLTTIIYAKFNEMKPTIKAIMPFFLWRASNSLFRLSNLIPWNFSLIVGNKKK